MLYSVNSFRIPLLMAMVVAGFAAATFGEITFQMQDTVELQRSARKIMLDGFLLEWNTQTARPWGRDTSWQWNAMATPEGPAGYLTVPAELINQNWKIIFNSPIFKEPLEVNLPADTALKSDFVRVDRTASGAGNVYIVEWLFRWPETTAGVDQPVIVSFSGRSEDGNSLPPVVVRCGKILKRNQVWGGVTGRVIIIGLLALLYLYVQRRLKHQTARKESPHQ